MSKFSSPNINDFVNNQITSYNKIPEEDLNFEPFTEEQLDPIARIAAQTYVNTNKRKDIGNYKYLQDESTDDLAVYENNDEYHISIRGTSPETPVRDFFQDAAIALGSISTPLAGPVGLFDQDIKNVQDKIDKFKLKKPVHVSGHSKGGTIAGFIGVDNPDVRTTTFNRGDALPFVGDMVKCRTTGCENINNYRISGDTVGLIGSKFSNQRYFNMRPRKPTKEMKKQSEQLKSSIGRVVNFYDDDYFLPHPIGNFFDRNKDNILSHDTYARPLAKKIGAAGVAAAAVAAVYGVKKYTDATINRENLELYENIYDAMYERGEIADPEGVPSAEEEAEIEESIKILRNIAVIDFKNRLDRFTGARVGLGGMATGAFIGQGIYDVYYGRDLDNPDGEDEL